MTKRRFLGLWLRYLPAKDQNVFAEDLDALLNAARRDEREACAKIADMEMVQAQEYADAHRDSVDAQARARGCRTVAGAIRARGETP